MTDTEKKDKNGLTEAEFLAAYKPGDYERPSVTVDVMVFRIKRDMSGLQVLLIRRGGHPYLDCLALPGGFVEMHESGYEAAQRELYEETGITDIYMEQSYTMTQPDRDPRMWVIDIAYTALLPYGTTLEPTAADDAAKAEWFDVEFDGESYMNFSKEGVRVCYSLNRKKFKNGKLSVTNYIPVWNSGSQLAFDHAEILLEGLKQLQVKAMQTDLAFNLVPETFTMPMLQKVYEILLCRKLYHANFIKQMKDRVIDTGKKQKYNDRPPAKLYQYRESESLQKG